MKKVEKLDKELGEVIVKYIGKITPIEMIGVLESQKAAIIHLTLRFKGD